MTRNPTPIDAIAEAYTAEIARLDPFGATELGLPGFDHLVTDFSPEGHAERAAAHRLALAELADSKPVDAVDEVTLAAMRDRLGLAVELYEAGEYRADLNVIASPLQSCADVLDLMPTDSAADWEAIAARLAGIPRALAGYRASLREGLRHGPLPAQLQVTEGIRQATRLADPKESVLVGLAERGRRPESGLPDGLNRELQRAAEAAAASYAELAGFLRDELGPVAPLADAVGRDRYALHSRDFVSATVDLDETYEWGLAELARVAAEQERLIKSIAGAGAGIDEAAALLERRPGQLLHGTAALQEWMQLTAETAIERLDGIHFDIPEPVRTIECRIAPSATGGIYYTGPSEDFSRPGRMWWSVPPGVTEFATWREKTTVYHEGVPGHHLQIATATTRSDELNRWRRQVCWTSGHGEGWALYAERLMDEFGFLDDPGDRLGMLDGQRMRAVRVVLDIGVHCGKPAPQEWGGGIWDAAKAWECFTANVSMDESFGRFELNRYLGWPGQAPSYKLGQRLWEEARRAAAARATAAGRTFDLKEFHTKALNLGSIPLSVLPRALAD